MSLAHTTTTVAKPRVLRLLGLWVTAAICLLTPLSGRGATVSENELKAAFLYNFTKFVEWPATSFPSTNAPIQFAVFGDEEFSAKLKSLLVGKTAHGRAFEVKTLTNPQEAKNFHIVFVGSSEKRLAMILDATKKLPILTIGESDEFLDLGGIINLVFEEAQLGFEVNAEAAERNKLVISSKLLRLAKKRRVK